MIIIKYEAGNLKEIIKAISQAILQNLTVAIPTDTSYCLAALAANNDALDLLYKIKGRDFRKPVHLFPSTLYDVTDVVTFNGNAKKLAREFWPGPLTLVLPMLSENKSNLKKKEAFRALNRLAGNTGFLGFRKPGHAVPIGIVKSISHSITATSANISGFPDCYSGDEIIAQYKNRKLKPDILLHVDKMPKRKPSTVVKFETDGRYEILRRGPIILKQIEATLNKK